MIPISERLLAVRSIAEFSSAIDFELSALGFSKYAAQVVPNPHIDELSAWVGHHAMPAGWLDSAEGFYDIAGSVTDPVMQYLKFNSTPLVWSKDEYYRVGQHDRYELQAGFGLASGISIAMHLPNGRHFLLGVEDSRDLKRDKHLPELFGRIQLIAAFAQVAAERVFFATSLGLPPMLTPRERECLIWASLGKSSWETGVILGIQEQTVANNRRAIISKLQCANITHAAAKALRLGLI